MRVSSVPAAVVLVLALAAYLAENSWTLSRYSTRDFPTFYDAAVAVAEGKDPYDLRALRAIHGERGNPGRQLFPYIYPPAFAVLLRPLTFLPFFTANRVWAGLSHLSLAASLVLLARGFLRHRAPAALQVALLGSVALLFHPIASTLEHGQVNHFLLLLLLAFWMLRRSGREVAAGVALGVAAVLKMSPALLVGYALVKRERKLALVAVASGAALWAASMAAGGVAPTFAFFGRALPALGYGGEPPGLFASGDVWNGGWNGLSSRLGAALGLPAAVTPIAAYAAALWLLAGFARAVGRARAPRGEDDGEVAAVIVLMLLLSSWTYHHHFVLLLPVLALLFFRAPPALALALTALASVEWSQAARHWPALDGVLASMPAIILAALLALLWPRAAAGLLDSAAARNGERASGCL